VAKPKAPYLVGAYGMFWQTHEVNWTPGQGRRWQLLGKRGTNTGTLRVCDFRAARGFYILFDDHGANYVGLALGNEGIAARLVRHHKNTDKNWSRFCWFSFDDVVAVKGVSGWSAIAERDAIKEVSARTTVRELEALLIMVLGARDNKAQMRFIAGKPWTQVTIEDCQAGGALTKVDRDRDWLTDSEVREYLAELDHLT
jgi:hypothetical protein